jgi:hypothetical protein
MLNHSNKLARRSFCAGNDGRRWIGKSTPPIGPERFWTCFSFLSGAEAREKGNAVIARSFAGTTGS